ncbi:MAG: putative signal transducing protein [Chitinophagaceae bacterium]
MEKDWVVIFKSKAFEAEIVKGMLLENGIQAVLINRQDSEFVVIGEAELYVHESMAEKAVQLIKETGTI